MSTTQVFKTDAELASLIADNQNTRGPAVLESTTQVPSLKKSRIDKVPYELSVFSGREVFLTKREYVFIGGEYEKMVNRKLEKVAPEIAGEFQGNHLPWGQWFDDKFRVITHKDRFYLRYYIRMSANYKYSEKICHFENGQELNQLDVSYFYKHYGKLVSDSRKQAEHGLEAEDQITPRTVKIAGITRLRVGGITFVREGFETREDKADLAGIFDKMQKQMEAKNG